MKIVKLKQNEKYNREDVVECYEADFVERNTDWSVTHPVWGVEVPDDSPVGLGWKRRDGEWEGPDVESEKDARIDEFTVELDDIDTKLGVLEQKALRPLLDGETEWIETYNAQRHALQALRAEIVAEMEEADGNVD